MANALRGEVDLPAGDKTYTLRFGMNAVAEAETLLDMGIGEISATLKDPSKFRVVTWRALLWAALREHHKGLDLEATGEIIGEAGINEAIAAVGEAMNLSFPEEKAGAKNPPKASRKAGKTS